MPALYLLRNSVRHQRRGPPFRGTYLLMLFKFGAVIDITKAVSQQSVRPVSNLRSDSRGDSYIKSADEARGSHKFAQAEHNFARYCRGGETVEPVRGVNVTPTRSETIQKFPTGPPRKEGSSSLDDTTAIIR